MLNQENEDFWKDLIELAFQKDNEKARYLLGRIIISLPETDKICLQEEVCDEYAYIPGKWKFVPNSDKQFLKNLLVAR